MARKLCCLSTIVLLPLLGSCSNVPADASMAGEPARWAFDDLQPGEMPNGWKVAETNSRGTRGHWEVAQASVGKDGGILRLAATRNVEDTFNLAFAPGAYPADVELCVQVRADNGNEDQGGGVVWRALGPDDYYVSRWNPLESNVRTYHVIGGRRTMIDNADIETDPRAWHELRVRQVGTRITVWLDGEQLTQFEDRAITDGGQVGVWTKADAATSFDDFRVEAAGGL